MEILAKRSWKCGLGKGRRNHHRKLKPYSAKCRPPHFPGGEQQIAWEAAEVESLLDGSVSRDYAREMLVHAKGRALLAIRSAKDSEEAVQRCIDSVWKRSQGKLDRSMAEKVAVFAVQRLVDQHAMDPRPAVGVLDRNDQGRGAASFKTHGL